MRSGTQIIAIVLLPILLAIVVWRAVGDTTVTSFPLAMVFGFLAGLILNVMPCVLPVVGIKIHSLVLKADQDPQRIRLLGLAFAAGMLCVFVVLGLLAAFAKLGWGQAFQSDTFWVTLIVVLVVLALEAFGVYTIQPPGFVSAAASTTDRYEGLAGSFAKGMLATVLATPCGAPLLGATLTYALQQSPAVTLIVFVAVGMGMAFPYLILTWNPNWLSLLPRSGPWIQTFRVFTGFLVLATAVWLLWQRRFDGELVVQTVAFCLLISVAAWLYGHWTAPDASPKKQFFAPFATLLILVTSAGFCFLVMPGENAISPSASAPPTKPADLVSEQEWKPFQQVALDKSLAEGQTVMVMWTADW